MTIVKEVADAIKGVSETIDSIKTISDAISNGKDYLKTKHPHVADDLVKMCVEMRKSSEALAAASSIITHFRFVVGDTNATEASRFNEHLVDHKSQAETVEQRLRSMRGHCDVIEEHSRLIRENADPKGLTTLSAALGLHSTEKEKDLASALQGIYFEEMQYHRDVYVMAEAIKAALNAIQDKLGPPGVIDPKNVPAAATTLGEYATAFSEIESRCNHNALELQTSIDVLQGS